MPTPGLTGDNCVGTSSCWAKSDVPSARRNIPPPFPSSLRFFLRVGEPGSIIGVPSPSVVRDTIGVAPGSGAGSLAADDVDSRGAMPKRSSAGDCADGSGRLRGRPRGRLPGVEVDVRAAGRGAGPPSASYLGGSAKLYVSGELGRSAGCDGGDGDSCPASSAGSLATRPDSAASSSSETAGCALCGELDVAGACSAPLRPWSASSSWRFSSAFRISSSSARRALSLALCARHLYRPTRNDACS